MTDALTSKEVDLDNEAHDGGGIGNVVDIAERDNPKEEESLQSLEMDNEAHDNVESNGGTGKTVEEKSNVAPSIELELDYEVDDKVVIANVGDNTVTYIPLKEESCVASSKELEMDYEADDNDGAKGGTDEPFKEKGIMAPSIDIPLKEESCVASSKVLEMDNIADDNVRANGGTDTPLEEKSNVSPSIELELDYAVDDEIVIANVGDNTVTDIPLKEENCVAPSKELEMDYEADDNDGANGGTDEPLNKKINIAPSIDIPLKEESCVASSKVLEMDYEDDDNVRATGGTDKPLEEKSNVAPSIELELDYAVDDEIAIANVPLEDESCVTSSKDLEMDYEADDNDGANGGTDEPLKEENNMAPSIDLELDYEVDDEVGIAKVAPSKELEMDYEADDEVVIDSIRRNAVPVKPIEECFVALSKELELDYEADDEVAIDNVGGKFGSGEPIEEESNVAPSKELEVDFEADNKVVMDNVRGMTGSDKLEEKSNEILKVEQCNSLQPENPSPKELDIALHNCGTSISVKTDDDINEELEEGEIEDEDESPKKEVMKPRPRPECRFYAKGRCTRGAQCRFLHPGVPDLGGYSIFTPPRPVFSGKLAETIPSLMEQEPQLPPPPPEPQRESAWERGLRAAKQMRRLADQRKRVDSEYEEKKSSMSITQIEMDKEHDYNSRPATPMDKEHDYNSRAYYREDHLRTEPYDKIIRSATPSRGYYREDHFSTEPYNNNIRSARPSGGYAHDSYYEQLDPPSQFVDTDKMMRRRSSFSPFKDRHALADHQPSSKIPHNELPRLTGHEDSEYPWMGNFEKNQAGGYSPRSTRSSSAGSSISASSQASPFRYSSPESRRSSSRSRSRTPPGTSSKNQMPTQNGEGKVVKKCTAPLQKRLAGFASTKRMKSKSKSRGVNRDSKTGAKKLMRSTSVSGLGSNSQSQLQQQPDHGNSGKDQMEQIKETKVKIESSKSADLTSSKQKDPVKMNTCLPKNKIKLTLKAYHATRSPNKTVLEKLGLSHEAEIKQETGDGKKISLKRKGSDKESSGSTSKKKCYGDEGNQEKELVPTEHISNVIQSENSKASGNDNEDNMKVNIKNEEKEKKKKKSSSRRKDELMKQLKAVEDAITKKRDKLVEN